MMPLIISVSLRTRSVSCLAISSIIPDKATLVLTRLSTSSLNLALRVLPYKLMYSMPDSSRTSFSFLIIIMTDQRNLFERLLNVKSSELLSLTAISGIVLRTEQDSGEQDDEESQARYIYASEESIIEEEYLLVEHNRVAEEEIIRLEYQKEMVRLKAEQLERLAELSRNSSVVDRLEEIEKAKEKVNKRKGRMKSSIQSMLIILTRYANMIVFMNKTLQKEAFIKMKKEWGGQKGSGVLSRLVREVIQNAFWRIRKQQKIKKVTLKCPKVPEIEDILRKEMQRHKAQDKENQESRVMQKKFGTKIPKFV